MSICEKINKCPFFHDKMPNMPALAERFKQKYCQDHPQSCARYLVAQKLGGDKVPANLFPNQTERAHQILGE
ncbi:hypothetical protein H1S01_14460 [Heliobacterium chlorum]|uniref:Uncharacterized protein n=1 Tax=Heliobacterium chlorum TaxID=2698 RepID=A0ABR7T7Y3_HELCL|nr:hypothetical protein [Heliobacterium chlorum]MBC9785691.1 hypothetical protein [Heliobacterium chlorum]